MADATTRPVLAILPLPDAVVLPGSVVTITLDDADRRAVIDRALADRAGGAGPRILLVPVIGTRPAAVGAVAEIDTVTDVPGSGRVAVLRALGRARILERGSGERSGPWAGVDLVTDLERPSPRVDAAARELRVVLEEIAVLKRSRRLPELLRTAAGPGALADAATAWSDASGEHKLSVLECVEVADRVALVLGWAKDLLAELQVGERIRQDVTEGLEKTQREFLLRQQLAAIRKELGDDGDDPAAAYREALASRVLPVAVRAAVEREIDRLERSGGQGAEQGWIRTWLDRVLALPWGQRSDDRLELADARAILDADHHGLNEVKDRIIEALAVRALRERRRVAVDEPGAEPAAGPADEATGDRPGRGDGTVLTLVGPPGVGKTSLGESIARAMGRRFVRVALGGVRDEAEIRGHRRTYVGAQPGRIVRAIAEAGTMNPVVLLDEIDKVSPGGWAGDPTAALLEVLDPAQNHTFRDHYLELELDLSEVIFLATANVADAIPAPLADRMEVVQLDGYRTEDKLAIARAHLLPRQLSRHGLRPDEVTVEDDALVAVIEGYTREAGVRGLERSLATVLRKVAARVATDTPADTPGAAPVLAGAVVVDRGFVRHALGRPRTTPELAATTAVPGVATGLAVTGAGGDVLFVEASASAGEPGLVLTGQLGEVMKESAVIALSYLRANAARLGIDPALLERRFHVHVPAGAVPKDGPSAGITITAALVSLLTGRVVRPELGMTGEVTLRGRVLPIGGVTSKVLAAQRAGLRTVLLPRRNEADVEDLPTSTLDQVEVRFVDDVDDVLAAALG